MITVSTVIPVCNREQFVVKAIDSVASQTYPSTEIIVVDDASTDDTPRTVESLCRTFNNLSLIRLPKNVGAALARNIGARAAKGKLVAFLDSDDRWYPERLKKQIVEFEKDKDVIAVFSGALEKSDKFSFPHIPPSDITLSELYRSEQLGTCSTALILKSAFDQVGGFDPSLPSCQDWDISISLAKLGKIRVVQEVLIEYNRHSGERISNNKRDVLIGHNLMFNKIYEMLSDPILIRILRGGHQGILAEIHSADDPYRACVHALKALALAPSPRKFRAAGQFFKLFALTECRRLRRSCRGRYSR